MPMPTATEIIERVKARYATCRSYEDRAEIHLTTAVGPHPWKKVMRTLSFRTAFVRPDWMHHDSVGDLRMVVMWSPTQAREGYLFGPESTPAPVRRESAVRTMLGDPWYGRMFLPLLLPAPDRTSPLFEFRSPWTLNVAENNDPSCHLLSNSSTFEMRKVWIDADSLLVRRIETRDLHGIDERVRSMESLHAQLGDPATSRETKIAVENALANLELAVQSLGHEDVLVCAPRIDHDIDPKVFEFTPPG